VAAIPRLMSELYRIGPEMLLRGGHTQAKTMAGFGHGRDNCMMLNRKTGSTRAGWNLKFRLGMVAER